MASLKRVPSLKMLPISIIGSIVEHAVAERAAVAVLDLVQVGERRPGSRAAASTPVRCQPVRFAPVTQEPSRSVSSATMPPIAPSRMPTGPIEPGLGAERRLDLLGRGRRASPAAAPCSSLSSCRRRSPRTSASQTLPSSATTGIALLVVRASMPRKPRQPSIVVTPGVSTSATGALGGEGARVDARDGHLDVGGVVAAAAARHAILARAATAPCTRAPGCRP